MRGGFQSGVRAADSQRTAKIGRVQGVCGGVGGAAELLKASRVLIE